MGGGDQTTGQAGKVVSPVDLPVYPDADITAEHTHLRALLQAGCTSTFVWMRTAKILTDVLTEKDLLFCALRIFFQANKR